MYKAQSGFVLWRHVDGGEEGFAPMRRMERNLVSEYESALCTMVAKLTDENFDDIVAIAELPDGVSGYEDLKLRRATACREQLASRIAAIV